MNVLIFDASTIPTILLGFYTPRMVRNKFRSILRHKSSVFFVISRCFRGTIGTRFIVPHKKDRNVFVPRYGIFLQHSNLKISQKYQLL